MHSGIVALDSPIVQATQRAVSVIIRAPRVTFAGSSTDANWRCRSAFPPSPSAARRQLALVQRMVPAGRRILLPVLVLTGLDGVTKPALQVRQAKQVDGR